MNRTNNTENKNLPQDIFNEPNLTRPNEFRYSGVLIFATIIGLLSGGVGALVLQSYYPPTAIPTQTQETTINHITPFITTQSDRDAVHQSQKSLVRIYKNTKRDLLSPGDMIGIGVALTSDGWIAVPQDTLANISLDTLLIAGNSAPAVIEKSVVDPFTHLVFIKIKRDDLQVVPFAASASSRPGDTVLAFEKTGSVHFHILLPNTRTATTPNSSETLDVFTATDPETTIGSILFTGHGELLGIITHKFGSVPISILQDTADTIIKKGSLQRPKLGVNFIDLGLFKSTNPDYPKEGALIMGSKTTPAITRGSVASTIDIKEGDIITKFDSIDIGPNQSLVQILSLYKRGVTIPMTIWRNKETKTLNLKLE